MAEFTGKFCLSAGLTQANYLSKIHTTPLTNGLMIELLVLDNADLDDLAESLGTKRPALKNAMTRQKMKLVKLKKASHREGSLERQNAFLAERFNLPKPKTDRPNDAAEKTKRPVCENCVLLLAANKADQEKYEKKLDALERKLEEANERFKEFRQQSLERIRELKQGGSSFN